MTRSNRRSERGEEVFFVVGRTLDPGGVELHRGNGGDVISKPLAVVREEWERASGQVEKVVAAMFERTPNEGYALSEVSVSLGFSAEGKLAFIAKAGIETSITLQFKRRDLPS